MIGLRAPRPAAGPAPRSIVRPPSRVRAYGTPWLSIGLASFLTSLPLIAGAPSMPPLGYLMLLGWRQLHPGLLPVWAGLIMGMVDDLFSGQPFGSGLLLWSASMLLLDAIEFRFPWRNFVMEWIVASGMIVAYLALAAMTANHGAVGSIVLVVPQMVFSILVYPVIGRIVALADSWRLGRGRKLR